MDGVESFVLKEKKGIKYYSIKSFDDTGLVKAIFTTRIGGISDYPFNTLNLSINDEDNSENVKKNFQLISKVLDTPIDNMVLSDQVHSNNIKIVTKNDLGKGLVKDRDYNNIDALITKEKGIALCTFYADCVPLFFLDKRKKVIALAHAGWKGTVSLIGKKVVNSMVNNFNSNPTDILVAIGPSIGPCCYEVGNDVYNKFNDIFTKDDKPLEIKDNGKWNLDLWHANMLILKRTGIPQNNISISRLCTSCNNDIFFSYRKEDGKTGRMAAMIELL